MMKGRAKSVGSKLEKNTPEQTHPGIEATTGTTAYKHSTLKATPYTENWELAVTTTFATAASQRPGKRGMDGGGLL